MWHITNVVNFHHEYGGYAYATRPLKARLLKPSDNFKVTLVYDKRKDHPDSERSQVKLVKRILAHMIPGNANGFSIKARG